MESPYTALQNWHETMKSGGTSKQYMRQFMHMEGQTVIEVNQIPTKLKAKMIKAAERGYSKAKTGLWPAVLKTLSKHVGVPMGYIGKSNGYIWVPNDSTGDDKLQTLQAIVALTGEMHANSLNFSRWMRTRNGYRAIDLDVSWRGLKDPIKGEPQLHNFYRQLTHQIDLFMAETREARQPLIDLINSDEVLTTQFHS
jgi:hypothetical protein